MNVMNISHIESNEQQSDDEHSYIAAAYAARDNKAKIEINEPLLEKVLAVLDDSTPNYVLGYN